MKKEKGHISGIFFRSILLGSVIVGFLAISTIGVQLPERLLTADATEEVTTEKGTEDQGDQKILKAFEAIPSSLAQITLAHEYLLIDVLPELEEDRQENLPDNPAKIIGRKVLKILFQRIISPNAP